MKFTSIVAMIGCASAFAEGDTTPVWGLRSITDHREEAQTQIAFGNTATENANARPPLRSHVQIEGSDSSDSDSEDESLVQRDDWPAHVERFRADSDDLFMRSVLDNYSSEGLTGKDGDDNREPNGVFTISESQGKALAAEVLGTHKGIKGAALSAYMGSYWGKAWGHFDVNRTGAIPILYAPQLMRFLASDQYVQL
mgnify:CR=1 FL=1